MIAGAALKIIYPEKQIRWDEKRQGEYDENTYQIDLSIYSYDNVIMGEAKDHIKQSSKVSRPEIDKLAGSLIELNYDSGLFFSATDYTEDAYRKSADSIKNPNAKNISLVHVRPSEPQDRDGRLEVINISVVVYKLDTSKILLQPLLEQADLERYNDKVNIQMPLKSKTRFGRDHFKAEAWGDFMDEKDNVLGSYHFVKEFTEEERSQPERMETEEKGVWNNVVGEMIFGDEKFMLSRIGYHFYYIPEEMEFNIEQTGTPVLLIKYADSSDEVDKLITDEELRKIQFKDNGEIIL
ncbi:restriction endonuclease [Parabacteroides faecis]|uniref:Restriction endonuclease type IV Mrr domain-containing protein n=1 Tax=Parabacteroides faecis TaxID=1217282 RepID=A0ABR6KWA2_9BACT|nr:MULTISPECIES: restriction endonuclease [Parabacteroides]MBB4625167.1 hypothetical protein [Parabacteroides faecis]GGK18943.1 hypothetical protein GCM10007084_47780 [Parabacteroides faecis]